MGKGDTLSRDLQRVRGEVVERDVPVARPLPAGRGERVVVVHEHRYPDGMPTEPVVSWREPESVREGLRWDRLALYLGSLLFAVVIAALLVAAGVLDVSLPPPPWKP